MPRKVTPAQYNRMVDAYNRKLKQAANKHNREVKRAIDAYNREVRAHNARVRANRRRLNAEIARLNRQRSTTRYVTVQTSTIALHTAYTHVGVRPEYAGNGPRKRWCRP
jgi:hypothetical protein